MEEELVEVRDNVVLPMQMWKIFKGERKGAYRRRGRGRGRGRGKV